jgi:hypothetical protein
MSLAPRLPDALYRSLGWAIPAKAVAPRYPSSASLSIYEAYD